MRCSSRRCFTGNSHRQHKGVGKLKIYSFSDASVDNVMKKKTKCCTMTKHSTSFAGGALLVVLHCVQEDVKQADQVCGSGRVLGVELNTDRQRNKLSLTSLTFEPMTRRGRRLT